MSIASNKRQYLARAEEAALEAEKARSPQVKQSWQRIAQGYRHLAGLKSKKGEGAPPEG